ncbi:MAG: prolyl oligopeptidase family serine peptidase [Blastomonas sp.]
MEGACSYARPGNHRPALAIMLCAALALVQAFLSPVTMARDDGDAAYIRPPRALVIDGAPPVPAAMTLDSKDYLEPSTARFASWDAQHRAMIVARRTREVTQLFRVDRPGGALHQLSFARDPVRGAYPSPDGSILLVDKDKDGDEAYQIYALVSGRLKPITDGSSRNQAGPWSPDGRYFAFGSNQRTGVYDDIHVFDSKRGRVNVLLETLSGGWAPIDFTPDGTSLLVFNYVSAQSSQLHLIDMDKGAIRQLTRDTEPAVYAGLQFAPDGTLWAATDKGGDALRIGTIDMASGAFEPLLDFAPFDVASFRIAPDGRHLALVVNHAGMSELYLHDIAKGTSRRVETLEAGVIGGLEWAPWGELGFSFSSNRSAGDAYSLDPDSMAVRRWTISDGDNPALAANVLPELVEISSFDGEAMSGLLFRPDPARHPGPRPAIISLHGGPEGQATARFIGRSNYLVNELGIAIFYPNVRGSTGFGRRFMNLDDGPFRREDALSDVGAFLDVLASDAAIDAGRIGVTGSSYGGYLCYASTIRFGAHLRAANCNVAISSFVTFLENTQSYRRDLRRAEYGDERDPLERAKLEEISPLTQANRIAVPLLVVTGLNDPRVPPSEAEQIVSAIRANGGTAWHLKARNEGHGFARRENLDYRFFLTQLFWRRNLLGQEGLIAD